MKQVSKQVSIYHCAIFFHSLILFLVPLRRACHLLIALQPFYAVITMETEPDGVVLYIPEPSPSRAKWRPTMQSLDGTILYIGKYCMYS